MMTPHRDLPRALMHFCLAGDLGNHIRFAEREKLCYEDLLNQEESMASLTKQKKEIKRWKKVRAGKRRKRALRQGSTPVFPIHPDKK